MKIAIIGHGRMGHIIEEVARRRGHHIACVIDVENIEDFSSKAFREADVAIEFTRPDAAPDNILRAFAAGVPVVSGTTGWLDSLPALRKMCDEGKGTLFYASNYSIGVNIFMSMNRWLAKVMNRFPAYRPEMLEVHHIHKLDHPSGTAITLAEEMIGEVDRLDEWKEPADDAPADAAPFGDNILPIGHRREGEVPGIHTITWQSADDEITITHSAKSRRALATGAVMAAEWLCGRPAGYYTMRDMLPEL